MTDIIVSVRSSGGDYTSLAAALSAEQADLVTLDSNLRIQIYDDFSGILDGNVRMNNYPSFVTDDTHRVYIEAPVGHRHTGQLGTGATISGNATYDPPFRADNQRVTIDWMIVHHRSTSLLTGVVSGVHLEITNSLIYASGDSEVSSIKYGYNTLFVSTDDGAYQTVVKVPSSNTTNLDYCTIIGGAYVGAGIQGGITATNCVVYNPNGAPYSNPGPLVETLDGNVWSGATDYGTNSVNGLLTTDFTNFAGGDFSSKTGTIADGKGASFVFSPGVISLPTDADETTASITLGATTDTAEGTLYAVIDTAANLAGITEAQIIAGTDNVDAAAEGDGSAAISTTSPSIAVTGMTLSTSTQYSYAIVQVSSGGNSNIITGTFNTPATVAPAPVISSATGAANGANGYTGSVSTDTANGTLYYLATVNATETEGAILAGATQAVSATGVQAVAGSGLTAGTNYYTHFVHVNSQGTSSNVLSSSVFVTNAESPSAATLSIATDLRAGAASTIDTGVAGFNPTNVSFVHKDGSTINLPITTAFVSGVGAVTVPILPATQAAWVKFGLGKVVLTDGADTVNFHGAYASGYVNCTGVDGTVIPTGEQVRLVGETDSAKEYFVYSDTTISDGTAQAEVVASWAYDGTTNHVSGTAMEFKSPVSGLSTPCTVADGGITGGKTAVFADIEPVLLPPANFKVIQVRDAVSTESSIFSAFSSLPVDGCQLIYDTTKADIHVTGLFKSSFQGSQSVYLFDTEDSQIKPFDVVTVTTLGIVGVSTTSAKPGTTITVTVQDASLSGKVLSCPSGFITLTSQDATTLVFDLPDPKTFGTRVLNYNEATAFSIADGEDIASFTLTITPDVGYDFATITELSGIYADDVGLTIGSQAYGVFSKGSGTADLATGIINPTTIAQYTYWLRDSGDGIWSLTSATELFEDPYKTKVTIASPVFTEGSVLEGYTGAVPVNGDLILHDAVTSPSGIPVTILPSGVWVLDSMPALGQTFDVYVATAAGDVGSLATITYTPPVFSIGTMPTTTPTSGETLVIPVFGIGTYTATLNGLNLPILAQTSSEVTIVWPDLTTFDNLSLTYDTAYDLVITDTDDAEFDTVSVTTIVATGQVYGEITSVDINGAYPTIPEAIVGAFGFVKTTTGDIVVNPSDGSYTNNTVSTADIYIFSTTWNTVTQISDAGEPLPVITQHPTAGAITYGDNTSSKTFTVSATDGTGNLTYQWEYSDGGAYVDVVGATDALLVVTGDQFVDGTNSGRLYRCKVSNVGGTTTSSTGTLVLVAPSGPTIIVQPSAGSVQAGNASSSHTMSVTASSATSYQWEFTDGGVYTNVTGATTSSLTVLGSDFVNNSASGRLYRCKVSNNVGTITSQAVGLTITPAISTAPTLSNAVATSTGASTATASVVTTESGGTLYTLFSTNANETETSIRNNGTTTSVTLIGVQNVTTSSLVTDTLYYAHFVHVDSDSNSSNVVTSPQFLSDAPNPIIYSIDGDNDVYPGQSCIISGANFGNSVGSVTLGGQDQIVTDWTATSITITVVKGALDFASNHQLVVTLP